MDGVLAMLIQTAALKHQPIKRMGSTSRRLRMSQGLQTGPGDTQRWFKWGEAQWLVPNVAYIEHG